MKVTIDVRHVGLPGIGRFATELTAALRRRAGGSEVVPLVAPGQWRARREWLGKAALESPAGGVQVRSLPYGLLGGRAVATSVRRSAPDIHHSTHLTVPTGVSVPVVLTVHDLFPLAFPGHARSRAAAAYYRRVLPRAVRRADATVAVSDYTAKEMTRVLGVTPTAVIGHGVDHTAWRCAKAEDVLPRGYVLYVGTAKPHKNLGTVIRAHASASHRPPLVLAGPTTKEAQRVAAFSGDRVTALGRVPDADMPGIYRGAGVVVVPSLYEGVGLAALEAMSFGVPVAAADAPGVRETVGAAAALVPATSVEAWADVMGRLVPGAKGMPLRETLIDRGREHVAGRRWDDAADAYLRVYEQVVRA